MLGSSQADRSNAVGHNPSYLPELNPGMNGGNTYNGASSEPTIQDYENIFGPSARDIKTDLQRFKRHGRWHLPDVLKGPNPWLTDRVDGLITDATNSPFTTRILPYLYKEDPDGKFTWNVWQFDEGMASRVPYESAARTLTQSKREFSGYMVRHGMAIVLEHNFMMSPKGRENFKNQLNQLIGSIQYSNDFDVHMALVLAPSYQKTMREKYFTVDKSPGQICREFCDLFGMMQKNVNALDILIEEAKAILKTWCVLDLTHPSFDLGLTECVCRNGPMPDFLLCNSKLTFQLTMTPEKTNYMTQGSDGTKRLKQGPDISSYRGLSVIHSRAFSLEVGQQPRDILRRRVRTAEYYRILPNKENVNREFELYTEERDTWFTMTFQDLLRYAMHPAGQQYHHFIDGGLHGYGNGRGLLGAGLVPYGADNHQRLHAAYQDVTKAVPSLAEDTRLAFLGAPGGEVGLGEAETNFLQMQRKQAVLVMSGGTLLPVHALWNPHNASVGLYTYESTGVKRSWGFRHAPFDLGVRHVYPRHEVFPLWDQWHSVLSGASVPDPVERSMVCLDRLTPRMQEDLFLNLQNVSLNNPFKKGEVASPRTPEWNSAYLFYLDIYRRLGTAFDYVEDADMKKLGEKAVALAGGRVGPDSVTTEQYIRAVASLKGREPDKVPERGVDITVQFLDYWHTKGSVNHLFQFMPGTQYEETARRLTDNYNPFAITARGLLLTYEMLVPLMSEYTVNGVKMTGLDYLCDTAIWDAGFPNSRGYYDKFWEVCKGLMDPGLSLLQVTAWVKDDILELIQYRLNALQKSSEGVTGAAHLCMKGLQTWPMMISSSNHLLHPTCLHVNEVTRGELERVSHSTMGFLGFNGIDLLIRSETAQDGTLFREHLFLRTPLPAEYKENVRVGLPAQPDINGRHVVAFWKYLRRRIMEDPLRDVCKLGPDDEAMVPLEGIGRLEIQSLQYRTPADTANHVIGIAPAASLAQVAIDLNGLFRGEQRRVKTIAQPVKKPDLLENVEIVIVRPNIEHNMLGIIMGLAGSELGYTLWGQTELSCYDDSMHGIWGMSYKYHERAIVFNERNLVRLWDIAYDGYNGGKDDTYVDWMDNENPKNGLKAFQAATLDLSRSYRGPSMMVMAFVHDREEMLANDGRTVFDAHFRRNWPSPIVFHDMHNPSRDPGPSNETLPLDYDNIQVLAVDDFRVFNNPLYTHSYGAYRDLMPPFHELHKMRKGAGQSSADAETHIDALAFQGSMRIKSKGMVVQEIQGSGHHGPDYVGVASVRAGKGIKYTGQAPALTHMV